MSYSYLALVLAVLSFVPIRGASAASPHRAYAQLLFKRLSGAALPPGDPRLAQAEALLAQGKLLDVASMATDEDTFYNVVLKNWAVVMLTVDENAYAQLNDAQALAIGVARDDLDARLLLTGDLAYGIDPRFGFPRPSQDLNRDFESFEVSGRSFKKYLKKVEPQWPGRSRAFDAAGILTSRGWAAQYYSGGTNRRAVEAVFRTFMCTPIEGWKEKGLPQFRIRRDVDRNPSGNPANFQNLCSSCHSTMDAMAGAFAMVDFKQDSLRFLDMVVPKYNQNETVYPHGYVTDDDSWVLVASPGSQERFGWRGAMSGYGIQSLGSAIASSRRFSSCMVERAYKQVCKKELTDPRTSAELVEGFEADGYRIKTLFKKTAVHPSCMGGS